MTQFPLIGITTYGRWTPPGAPRPAFRLPAVYVDAVRRAGGVPVLLPPGEHAVDDLVARLDGFVLSGGGDVEPSLYGAERHPLSDRIDLERDAFELALASAVVAHEVPALSICRGCQVLNVALGGTLVQHLPDVVGETIAHRESTPDGEERHPVRVEPGSRLAAALATMEPVPVSSHHQAVERVAPALVPVAWAADGTIEALELPGHPWLLAVQWHPEISAAEDASQQRLFDGLAAAARERAARREGGAR
jgi:putative glutamine amidotransferase